MEYILLENFYPYKPALYLPFARDAAGRHAVAGAFSPPDSRPPGMAEPARGSLTRHEKGAVATRGSLTRRAKGQAVRIRRRRLPISIAT